ncbi:hypothetical protein MARI151_30259 [Maribacter litoralis]|uniref:Uncharacterized protein n=1 Tax=Maribacter litoralis TaxID=2059726 RepID=A0A653SAU6_9FLAO|nr:hypothetical protein MARI151_30259 [Maribacter litoralis]
MAFIDQDINDELMYYEKTYLKQRHISILCYDYLLHSTFRILCF